MNKKKSQLADISVNQLFRLVIIQCKYNDYFLNKAICVYKMYLYCDNHTDKSIF
nr:MAG TPA: hypothetical protein [Bacteriophage sp.]